MGRGHRQGHGARRPDSISETPLEGHCLPDSAGPTAVYVDDRTLVRQSRFIQMALFYCGVRRRDLPDKVQEVLLAAWRAIQDGRFRPPPEMPLQQSLRTWLYGIAWRQASDYRRVAHHRYETSAGRSLELTAATTSTEEQLAARQLLEVLRRLPRMYREILELVALGMELREAAPTLGITEDTASARLRRGRELFLRAITRWRKPSALQRDNASRGKR